MITNLGYWLCRLRGHEVRPGNASYGPVVPKDFFEVCKQAEVKERGGHVPKKWIKRYHAVYLRCAHCKKAHKVLDFRYWSFE